MRKSLLFLVALIIATLFLGACNMKARADNIFLPTIYGGNATPTSAPPVEPTSAPPVEPTEVGPVTPLPTVVPVTPLPTIVPVDPTSTPTASPSFTPELIPPRVTATGTIPSATNTAVPPTATSTSTPVPAMVHYSGFETSTDGWNSSEEPYKFVRLTSSAPAYNSNSALKMETELSTSGAPVLGYSELQIIFKPGNVPNPGPHNLVGQHVSLEVYFPTDLFTQGGRVCGYMFVRDAQFNPQNTAERCFGLEDAEVWHHFELVVGVQASGHIDENFDADQIMSAGFRFNAVENLPYHKGWTISIDNVKVGYN